MHKQLSEAYNAEVPDSFVMAHAIKDTILHYGRDDSRRCPGYLFYGNKECSVGRFCDTDTLRESGNSGDGWDASDLHGSYVVHPRLRHLPFEFFDALVNLHDRNYHWVHVAGKGLSSEGKSFARQSIRELNIQGAANIIGLTELVA